MINIWLPFIPYFFVLYYTQGAATKWEYSNISDVLEYAEREVSYREKLYRTPEKDKYTKKNYWSS